MGVLLLGVFVGQLLFQLVNAALILVQLLLTLALRVLFELGRLLVAVVRGLVRSWRLAQARRRRAAALRLRARVHSPGDLLKLPLAQQKALYASFLNHAEWEDFFSDLVRRGRAAAAA